MKLLISPTNEKEALEAIAGGADIIDVKNPKEGALGANFPWVVRQIKSLTPRPLEVSCTIGENPTQPGSMALAALGAASLGVDYIKMGLGGIKTENEAVSILKAVNRAAKDYNPKIQVVAAGYADAKKIDAINPLHIPQIAYKAEVDVAMVDTAVKDGSSLFDHLKLEQLEEFIASTHQFNLKAALAGSLRKQHLPSILSLGADIAGLRGAACSNSDRVDGEIQRTLVEELVTAMRQAKQQVKRA